jgi:hypothetical protein
MKPKLSHLPTDSVYPFRGLNTLDPPSLIASAFSPLMSNVSVWKGEPKKRRGYSKLGTQVSGLAVDIQALVEFETSGGVKHLVMLTQERHYRYDTASELWVDIMPKFTIDGAVTGTKTLIVSGDGDLSALFVAGGEIVVVGSTANDGTYTIDSVGWSDPDFTIVVVDAFPSAVADGTVSASWRGDETDVNDHTTGTDASGKWLIVTNGVDAPLKWDGSGEFERLAVDLAGFITCKSLAVFAGSLFLGNVLTASSDPQSVAWSDTTSFEDFTTGNSGVNLFSEMSGELLRMIQIGDRLAIYGEGTIDVCTWVGGEALFSFEQLVRNTNLASARAVVSVGPYHLLASNENFYLFDGTRMLRSIGDVIRTLFRDELFLEKIFRTQGFYHSAKDLVFWIVPTSADTSRVFVLEINFYDLSSMRWSIYDHADRPTTFGFYSRDATLLWSNLSGSWEAQGWSWNDAGMRSGFPVRVLGSVGEVFKDDGLVFTDDSVAVVAFFETKDFVCEGGSYKSVYGRWNEVELELRGTGVSVSVSTDEGLTWTLVSALVLANDWATYRVPLDVVSRQLRVRLDAQSSTSDFALRFLRLWYREQGAR